MPLHLWLQAIALIAASKKGIREPASPHLGVTSRPLGSWRTVSVWRWRRAATPPMGGEGRVVEVDETYHGKVEHPSELRKDGKPFKTRKGNSTTGHVARASPREQAPDHCAH